MTDFERFAQALAYTETDDAEIAWGDPKRHEAISRSIALGKDFWMRGAGFMAMGRWQMHPAFFHDWYPEFILGDDSWDDVFRRALEQFWNKAVQRKLTPLRAAMVFHIGEAAYERGDWDEAYADRYQRWWHQLRTG